MCVILIAQESRLDASTIRDAVEANPDGNGFAWIQGGQVHWRKGITVKTAIKLADTKPLPYIFHARIATFGATCAALCHPFPITKRRKQTATIGSSKRGVVFHNGSWSEWDEYVNHPRGETHWSDSRAMADMVFADGDEALELIPGSQRVAMMTPTDILFQGTGWTTLRAGIKASNTHFVRMSPSLWSDSPSMSASKPYRSYQDDSDLPNQLDLQLRMSNRNYSRWSNSTRHRTAQRLRDGFRMMSDD